MPEAVTRPLRPIQNHSRSAWGWRARARRYWSIALPVRLSTVARARGQPLPTTSDHVVFEVHIAQAHAGRSRTGGRQ